MPYRTETFRIAMAGPADLSGLAALIEDGALDPAAIVAILVKTEGKAASTTSRGSTRAPPSLRRLPPTAAVNNELRRVSATWLP
jgi:hypothetical protein